MAYCTVIPTNAVQLEERGTRIVLYLRIAGQLSQNDERKPTGTLQKRTVTLRHVQLCYVMAKKDQRRGSSDTTHESFFSTIAALRQPYGSLTVPPNSCEGRRQSESRLKHAHATCNAVVGPQPGLYTPAARHYYLNHIPCGSRTNSVTRGKLYGGSLVNYVLSFDELLIWTVWRVPVRHDYGPLTGKSMR